MSFTSLLRASMLSGRELKLIIIPLCAFVLSFIFYCREYISDSVNSTKYIPLDASPSRPFVVRPPVCPPSVQSDPELPLQQHFVREDGLLEVNPDGGHPILDLIDRANNRWKAKLDRASKTLEEAVQEYVRRYNRRPPKGFDAWWRYVELHNVQLPDEYDQIWRDLEPFWGYDPVDLIRLETEREEHRESFTLGKNETGEVSILKISFTEHMDWDPETLLGGAHSIIDLLKDVQQHLPPFRAVISPHDNPSLFSDYEVKSKAIDAALRGDHMDISKIERGPRLGWLSGCSPTSPAREGTYVRSPQKKTFIDDHRKAMDPCLHPHLLEGTGEFLVHPDPGAEKLMIPQFAYCATALHHEIQIPTTFAWVDDILPRHDDPEWEGKLNERVSWRGSNTGMWHSPENRWKESQRTRLVNFANELNGTAKVLVPPLSDKRRVGEGVAIPKSKLNPAMLDISFVNRPVNCHPETCPELERMFEWRKIHGAKEAGSYKYIIDVDGNAWSSRFKRLITSNSLIFKATVYPEWFLDRIEPWVHYVPVQVDYSDVYDAITFFRGGLYGEGAHDDLAQKIAIDGRVWSRTFWRKEDITAYVFRLFLEYARVMNLDREGMSYDD